MRVEYWYFFSRRTDEKWWTASHARNTLRRTMYQYPSRLIEEFEERYSFFSNSMYFEFNVRGNERTWGYRRYFCHARVRIQMFLFFGISQPQPLTFSDINLYGEKVATETLFILSFCFLFHQFISRNSSF